MPAWRSWGPACSSCDSTTTLCRTSNNRHTTNSLVHRSGLKGAVGTRTAMPLLCCGRFPIWQIWTACLRSVGHSGDGAGLPVLAEPRGMPIGRLGLYCGRLLTQPMQQRWRCWGGSCTLQALAQRQRRWQRCWRGFSRQPVLQQSATAVEDRPCWARHAVSTCTWQHCLLHALPKPCW